MEYKYGNFDSPLHSTKHVKKAPHVIRKKEISCQTDPMHSILSDISPLDLTLGVSPSVTPSKVSYTSEINSSPELMPTQDGSSSAYISAESLKAESVNTTSKNLNEVPFENIPVIQKDMDAVSINFETPYLCNHKRVQRKLSLPQIKLLKKNSSQESDSPPDVTPSGSSGKKLFSVNSSSSSSSRFFSSLKKRKHALKRALSFQNSSTSSDDKVQVSELEANNVQKETDKPKTV